MCVLQTLHLRFAIHIKGKMSDLFVKTQAEFHRHQSELLHLELATCSRNTELASMMCRSGNRKSAERTIAEAELGYATLLRLMSDPEQAKRLTIKAKQELTKKMEGLRESLDELQRLRT
jgi:hypothetical protein